MLDAKLQIKAGKTVALVDAPSELPLEAERASLEEADAVLVFANDQTALDSHADPLRQVAQRGGLAWVAYPKAKQLGTDVNRDTIHAWAGTKGLTTVRQIAVDATWSAMRLKAR